MYSRQLGIFDVVSTGTTLIKDVGGLLGLSGDDQKRRTAIDHRKALALGGDPGSLAVLKCWAGIPTPELNNYPELASSVGVNETGSNCGMATADAKSYALAAYQQVLAIRSGQKPGTTAYPGLTTAGMLPMSGFSVSPLVLLGGAAVLFLVLRRGKKAA